MGLGLGIEMEGRLIIKHNSTIKSADAPQVRSALKAKRDQETNSSKGAELKENKEVCKEGLADVNDIPIVPIIKTHEHRRTPADILADKNRALMEGFPEKGATTSSISQMTAINNNSKAVLDDKLSVEQKLASCEKETDLGRATERSYVCQKRKFLPTPISSVRMLYTAKSRRPPKARIVPCEPRDAKKDGLLGNVPSPNLDSMRVLILVAAEQR